LNGTFVQRVDYDAARGQVFLDGAVAEDGHGVRVKGGRWWVKGRRRRRHAVRGAR
jgi:hypothetical protein